MYTYPALFLASIFDSVLSSTASVACFELKRTDNGIQHKLAMKATASRVTMTVPKCAADVNYLCLHTVTVATD